MRKLSILAGVVIISLGLGEASKAATLEWVGSASVSLATLKRTVFTGTAVATVNGSGGLGHLNTLRLSGGISGSTTNILTDPVNPTLISMIGTAHLGAGTLSGISGGAINGSNQMGIIGGSKLCILFPGCVAYLPIPFTVNGTRGLGLGGIVTVNALSTGTGVKISVIGAPWTVGFTAVTDVETLNGAESATTTMVGFVHGPASASSTAANLGGVIQVVSAALVETSLPAPDDRQALLSWGRFEFIPEPGLLLLLGSGVAGLLVLGAGRARR